MSQVKNFKYSPRTITYRTPPGRSECTSAIPSSLNPHPISLQAPLDGLISGIVSSSCSYHRFNGFLTPPLSSFFLQFQKRIMPISPKILTSIPILVVSLFFHEGGLPLSPIFFPLQHLFQLFLPGPRTYTYKSIS